MSPQPNMYVCMYECRSAFDPMCEHSVNDAPKCVCAVAYTCKSVCQETEMTSIIKVICPFEITNLPSSFLHFPCAVCTIDHRRVAGGCGQHPPRD